MGPFSKSLLSLLQHCFYFVLVFWLCGIWILAPQPGIKPAPPALEGKVVSTGTPGESLEIILQAAGEGGKQPLQREDREPQTAQSLQALA